MTEGGVKGALAPSSTRGGVFAEIHLAPGRVLAHWGAMQNAAPPEATSEKTLIEAIARMRLIVARYNGTEMRLAPHQLFSRHGELFVRAFNPLKNWRSEEERRLGDFKLAGLSDVALTEEPFEPLPSFDCAPPREGDQHLFAVAVA